MIFAYFKLHLRQRYLFQTGNECNQSLTKNDKNISNRTRLKKIFFFLQKHVNTMAGSTLKKKNSSTWSIIKAVICILKRTAKDSADVNWAVVSSTVNIRGGFKELETTFKRMGTTTVGANLTTNATKARHVIESPTLVHQHATTTEDSTPRKKSFGTWSMTPAVTCILKRTVTDSVDVSWVGVSIIANITVDFVKSGNTLKNLATTTAGTNLTVGVLCMTDVIDRFSRCEKGNGVFYCKYEGRYY